MFAIQGWGFASKFLKKKDILKKKVTKFNDDYIWCYFRNLKTWMKS